MPSVTSPSALQNRFPAKHSLLHHDTVSEPPPQDEPSSTTPHITQVKLALTINSHKRLRHKGAKRNPNCQRSALFFPFFYYYLFLRITHGAKQDGS